MYKLLYQISNPTNVEVICDKLLHQLEISLDKFWRSEVITMVMDLTKRWVNKIENCNSLKKIVLKNPDNLICKTWDNKIYFQLTPKRKTNLHAETKLFQNIYICGVFTDNPYSKLLEHNVVYIPITTLNLVASHEFNWRQTKALYNLIGHQQYHDIIDTIQLLAVKVHVTVLLLQC